VIRAGLVVDDALARRHREALAVLRARLDRLAPAPEPGAGLECRGVRLPLGQRTLVMGILNVTPDSFSGDGITDDVEAVIAHARTLVAQGADILDVGGESTRPGADEAPVEEELRRVEPVVRRLAAESLAPISIDTAKAAVAEAALAAGAHIVNDITGLRADPMMAEVAARAGAGVVAMHILGRPRTMQHAPVYKDVLLEVAEFLAGSVELAIAAGVRRDRIVVDPGIGFGKTLEHNLEILRRLAELCALGQPVLIGTSRKAFIGRLLGGAPPSERVEGTGATVALAIAAGADIVRVHDVAPAVKVARVADAIVRGTPSA
jgi:dihydropteroate synthase